MISERLRTWKARGVHLAAGLATLALLAGCAAEMVPGPGKQYGLEFRETQEAIQRGEGREALGYYEQAAEEFERRGRRLQAARAHSAVAFVAVRVGAYQKGVRHGLRALELLKREFQVQETLTRQADVHSVLGHTYRQVGDLEEARRSFEQGLELVKSFWGEHHRFREAHFLRSLGDVAFSQGDYQLALRRGEEAVRVLENFLDRAGRFQSDRPRVNASRNLAASLVLVGRAHRRLGGLAEAEAALRRALEIARGVGSKETEASALAQLGWVALARQDPVQARSYFEDALALATRLNHVSHLIFQHAGVGWSYYRQNHFEEALAAFRRSLDLLEDVRGQLQEVGLRGGYLEDKQGIYHGAVQSALALGKPEEAFTYAERARARAFLDLLGNQTVLSKGKTRALVEEEVRLRARLAEARALAHDPLEAGDSGRARRQIEAAERAYREFLDRVRKENLEQASLMAVEPVMLAEVQKLLPDGVTLLEYLVLPQESVLWVIDKSHVEVVRLPVRRGVLVKEVRGLRTAITEWRSMEEVLGASRGLYDRLVASARPHIRGDRLLIVPHDVLHYLPFGALRSPAGRWLVEEYTLATLPSASVLKYLHGKGEGASARALAVGNPDLGPALRLRYAGREARAVAERFPGAWVLVGGEATEARVKALSGQAGVLHFATHGELSEEDPLSSALLLTPEDKEDGRLEVRELFGLDLNARLVVLSACETGLGKLSNGDELVGLQRAFLYAGTRAVVTTLWKVDDRASFFLMREFYERLRTLAPAEALRQAQHATMRDFSHPFSWGAFLLAGVPW